MEFISINNINDNINDNINKSALIDGDIETEFRMKERKFADIGNNAQQLQPQIRQNDKILTCDLNMNTKKKGENNADNEIFNMDKEIIKEQEKKDKEVAKEKAKKEKEVAKENAKKDKELAKENAKKEKELAKENAKKDKELAKENAKKDKELAKENAKKEKELAKENTKKEKELAKEKAKKDKEVAKENAKKDKELAKENAKKDRKKDRKKGNGIIKADNNVEGHVITDINEIGNTSGVNKQDKNEAKVKGRPRIQYEVSVVKGINDDNQQKYDFLEVEEYCTEVTIEGILYYRDRNHILYDHNTHEEI